MVQVGQILVLKIDSERELNVIHDGKGRRVKFVLKEKHSEAHQNREEFYLSAGDCMKLSMYLAGIRNAMPDRDFDDEPTLDEFPRGKKSIKGED
jgi:hypothetical protein